MEHHQAATGFLLEQRSSEWLNCNAISPITSLFCAFSTMAYLTFQCLINSANQTSTSPRLRLSWSSIKQAISRSSALFMFWHPFSTLVSCWFHTHSHRCVLPAGIVLWNPNSDVDSMAAAVTFVRCTDSSTRPSFPRNHSWMPDKATNVEDTCLERNISALRRIAIPFDFIMK